MGDLYLQEPEGSSLILCIPASRDYPFIKEFSGAHWIYPDGLMLPSDPSFAEEIYKEWLSGRSRYEEVLVGDKKRDKKPLVCTCGSQSVGSKNHSSWCDAV